MCADAAIAVPPCFCRFISAESGALGDVSVGDILNESGIIGVSGTNVNDIDAKIHVHLTVTVNGTYINPKDALGKEATEIVSSMK